MPTKNIERYLGIIGGAKVNVKTPYLDLFKNTINPTEAPNVYWDEVDDTKAIAEVKERGAKGKNILKVSYKRRHLEPGIIDAEITLTAEEKGQMQAGGFAYIDGHKIPLADSIEITKAGILKRSILRTQNLMCGKLIKDGKYELTNGDTFNFGIPAASTVDWTATSHFVKHLTNGLLDYEAEHGELPDEILIGEDIATNLIEDEKFQNMAQKLGIAQVTTSNANLIIGRILNQELKMLDRAIDETATNIFAGNEVKLLNKNYLYRGYAGLGVKDGDTVKMIATDIFMGKVIKERPSAEMVLYAMSAFVPIISKPSSIKTIIVNIA